MFIVDTKTDYILVFVLSLYTHCLYLWTSL